MTIFTGLVILGLILVNAFYVAAEFGAVGAPRSRVRRLAESGNRLAIRLRPILEDGRMLDRYIAACQIGITLSSLVLGAVGQVTLAVALTPVFADWGDLEWVAAQSTAAGVVLVALTGLQVLLGELVPKSVALQYPTRTALLTVLPMRASLRAFSWFIRILNGSAQWILRALGLPYTGHRHIHSPEEINLLIAESRESGLLEPEAHERLASALRLGLRTARDLMVPRPQVRTLDAATPVPDALAAVAASPYTRLPVYRGSVDNVIGLLNTKDLVLRYVEDGRFTSLEEVVRPIVTVHETTTVDELLARLRERRSHQALVLDEYGAMAGLVTLEDVLEELLGEVSDELKAVPQRPERLPDGRVRLPGRLRLDEARAWIGTHWQGGAVTVGGHITDLLGHLPAPGERITIDGVEVEVERVEQRAVTSILAMPVPARQEADRG